MQTKKLKKENPFLIMGLLAIIVLLIVFAYNEVIKPEKYAECVSLGNQYLIEENYEDAILNFEKAIKLDKKSIEARLGIAKAYVGQNKVDNAKKYLKEAQNLDIENEKLTLEILYIIRDVDKDAANELLYNFLDKVGKDNVSEKFKSEILNSTNKEELNNLLKKANNLYDSAVEGDLAGQYEKGSKDAFMKVIKKANKVANHYFCSQQVVDDMYIELENAIDEFQSKVQSAVPSNLASIYINKITDIDKYVKEAKLGWEEGTLCNADTGNMLYNAQLEYEYVLYQIYNDLEKYLSPAERSQLKIHKAKYEKEVAAQEYEFDNIPYEYVGTWMVQEVPDTFGKIARRNSYDLINKYM